MAPSSAPYATYDQVPTHRRQWFFWLMWFFLAPVAVGILVTGDVYYPKRGEVRSFGIANRIVAGLIALGWLYWIVRAVVGS
jgi:hypothetical protein